jgi:hypothetical protein
MRKRKWRKALRHCGFARKNRPINNNKYNMPLVTIQTGHTRISHFEASLYAIPHLINQFQVEKTERRLKNMATLLEAICSHCKISVAEVESKSRLREIVFARHLYFFLATHLTSHSLVDIGKHIGGRDHTTVIHGRNTVISFLQIKDSKYFEAVNTLAPHLIDHPAVLYGNKNRKKKTSNLQSTI